MAHLLSEAHWKKCHPNVGKHLAIPCHNFRHKPSYKRQKKAPFILSYVSITEYYLKTYSLIIKSLIDSALFCLQFWIFVQSAVKERILKWPYKVYFIFFPLTFQRYFKNHAQLSYSNFLLIFPILLLLIMLPHMKG